MWNEHIRPLRDDSLFWHGIWKEAGRPAAGALAAIMRSTRAKYHRAVKMHKSKEMSTRRSVIAKCVSDGINRDFWGEIKKLESKNKTMPNAVDGFTDDGDIANSFAQKYSKLYESLPTSHQEIADLRRQTTDDLYIESHCNEDYVNIEDVKKSLLRLRHGKSDGIRGTDSDHFIYCSAKFQILVSGLINSMFIHGYTPIDLLESVLISIPKDLRGRMCTNENYRGIVTV